MSDVVTPDGVVVVIGQRWRSCDPRDGDRVMKIEALEERGEVAVMRNIATERVSRIRVDRLRKHARGYELAYPR